MIIRTVKDKRYFTASNEAFNDPTLSWGARGIMGYLLSKGDGWTVRNYDLYRKSPDGKARVDGYIKELREAGYMRRFPVSTGKGTIDWITEVYESKRLNPDFSSSDFSTDENSSSEISSVEKQGDLASTNSANTESNKKELSNGASPATAKLSFLSDLPEGERLLSLLVEYDSSKTETEWTESRFPNLVLQRKYQAAAAVLGPRLEEAIIAGLSKPGIPLSGLINYLCGYTPPVDLGNDDLYPVDQTEQAGGIDSLKASLARKHGLTPQLLRVERAGKNYRVSVLNPLSKNGRAARASIVEVESIEIDQAPPPEEIGPPPSDDWTEEAWQHWHERGRPARPRGMADSTFAGLMQREVETKKTYGNDG